MPFTVTMPKLSPTMTSGQIVKWYKKEGDLIKEGDVLIEVATDKATVEYTALDDGYLRKILIPDGGEARVNQPIAVFTASESESIEGYRPEGEMPAPSPQKEEAKSDSEAPEKQTPAPVAQAIGEPVFAPMPPLQNYTFEFPTGMQNERVLASPSAKRTAEDRNIDLSTIKGSGPNGRVVMRDLEGVEGGHVGFHSRRLPTRPPGSYTDVPLTPMRKAIGKRLQESKMFIPHFYVRDEIVVDSLVEAREQLKKGGIKITYNDFVIRATALALKEHPIINSGFDNQKNVIIQFDTIDVAIAVSINGGLITPIIRHTDYKNVSQISHEVKELVALARKQKLTPEQYQGGSFTISNLGMFGIQDFQAIINPPQAAILAVGGIINKPIVNHQGMIQAGKTLSVWLSVDHRVIDGAEAAAFLVTLKKYLNNPSILLI
ncbi:MAG: pyruvate dehydrogenase complex dihydrolipoamide acetyltransferase [Simkaniaceae bacterium]|nr:pyruvate dehydrogenase complex dihydrolipoamide acetyltransferase [Simkaniaceae bacterium]